MAENQNEDNFKNDVTSAIKHLASEQSAIKKIISEKKKTKLRERITGLQKLQGLKGL